MNVYIHIYRSILESEGNGMRKYAAFISEKERRGGGALRAILRVVTRRQVWVSIPFATSRIIVSPRYVPYRGCTQRLCTHVSLAQVAAMYVGFLLRDPSGARAFRPPPRYARGNIYIRMRVARACVGRWMRTGGWWRQGMV